MNEQQANKWRKTRTMGKAKYVMYYGVLLWGVLLTAIFTGLELLTQSVYNVSWMYIRLAVFGSVGFFIANFRWESREKRFQSR
ncbi:hypothetical protein CBW46_010080 [Paenibacillus xerothermodurans]|uniref:Uncharacterized protein n=2 Tax=Paenibacillus xerothermodurans TaxID=1977292 RepID=A0A2W1NBZ0_PAEXE|nr:hypothetical protein CBW46_010080 [Paenibacillus xerothermodurans]